MQVISLYNQCNTYNFITFIIICIKGLHAFEQEGIQNISTLKDQLVSAGHDQTATILNRHGDVISRWNSLLGASNSRKQRLLRMQDQFRQIEELYLTFAKKASAFNSWFENAEEDLTDPVRCNSIEEIRALREAHAQFQVSIPFCNGNLFIDYCIHLTGR